MIRRNPCFCDIKFYFCSGRTFSYACEGAQCLIDWEIRAPRMRRANKWEIQLLFSPYCSELRTSVLVRPLNSSMANCTGEVGVSLQCTIITACLRFSKAVARRSAHLSANAGTLKWVGCTQPASPLISAYRFPSLPNAGMVSRRAKMCRGRMRVQMLLRASQGRGGE